MNRKKVKLFIENIFVVNNDNVRHFFPLLRIQKNVDLLCKVFEEEKHFPRHRTKYKYKNQYLINFKIFSQK